jgi:large subunit ribosomal protein L25
VLHVTDLKVDEGVTILADPETVVATVAVLREEAVEETAPAAAEAAEPEVIGKGKKEDEE